MAKKEKTTEGSLTQRKKKDNKRASGPKENNEIRKKLTIFANTFVKRNTQNTP